jgi:hypothetical protein
VPLTDALDDHRRQLLRTEVGRLRARESRRVFDPMVYVGVLGGPRSSFVVAARDRLVMDDALRADVVGRLLEGTPPDCRTAWLVRPGLPELHDDDLRWLAAARLAFGAQARDLDGCYALTRTGWLDVAGDESRRWVRLRI